jgi:hypothetical protein
MRSSVPARSTVIAPPVGSAVSRVTIVHSSEICAEPTTEGRRSSFRVASVNHGSSRLSTFLFLIQIMISLGDSESSFTDC